MADTISGFDPKDFDFLACAEIEHFWFAARRKLIVDLANKYAIGAKSFLEIGCGSGNVINAMAREREWDRIVGTEIHPSGLAHARPRLPASVELLQVDARRLPFSDTFDLIGAFDVLEHIADDQLVLSEIHRALALGGTFIATVPQHPSLWSVADEVAYHERRYERGELQAKLKAAGFRVVFSTSYTALLLPLMAVSRLRVRRNAGKSDARASVRQEFDISSMLNRILTMVLRAEVGLTARGMSWPIGGSRVVVAQKA
ncbi:class I SAM-dependent methyltransferase [Microvirga lenta]|uniref:class I SAM-dependent methyltransferase n=1 Tax=Microvirga lenta TaxID=2881337 RepID=UPI001D00044D|nr:class I SAM-dependent methyltransferase [Microvirga lenta]MCB5175185.1 class I SAM-dependent methyltransferase [Microvirga lenta]